jgi:hypothetical protein
MENNQLLTVLAVVLVVLSVLGLGVTMMKASDFREKVTGYATSGEGYVNISITTTVSINVTDDMIDFKEGGVDAGKVYATLESTSANPTIADGSWPDVNADADSIVIENIGNINVSLNISSADGADFFNGAGSNYSLKLTNKDAGSCSGGGTDTLIVIDGPSGVGTASTNYCAQFSPVTASNEVYLDAFLTVWNDENLGTSAEAHNDVLTITASATA